MSEEIKVQVAEGQKELTILTGKAIEQKPSEKIIINGNIKSVREYYQTRNDINGIGVQEINPRKSLIIVNRKEMNICLMLDPENYYGMEIVGRLQFTDELNQFHINKSKMFSKDELVKLIKFNRMFFADATKHREMVTAFQKVSSIVNIKANDNSDERGNKERAYVKDVTTNAPTEFLLSVPIFKGFPATTFKVEVCLDVIDGVSRFWFESVELHEITQSQIDQIFDEQLKGIGLVVIEQ